jgi:ribose transport system ATP-binding protein
MTDEPTSLANGALLRVTGIVKEFPGVRALGGVDLDVRAGEVHCLLGQNGAGKSTLIKVLSGFHQPDQGTITWDGEEVFFSTPAKAIEHGVATIYQELDLVPHLDVAENVFLGHEVSRLGFSQRFQARKRVRELLARLGHSEISPTKIVGELSPAKQQIVSMARALSRDTRLLVLDEPSAVLDQGEVKNLFRVIRDLTAEGVAVVYISHRLEEIREIGDRITVLKDGRTVATGLAVADTQTAELIRLMTGRSIEYVFPQRGVTAPAGREVVLDVQDLGIAGVFSGVNLTVHAGEIVGLAGLVGAGRSEIIETVYGARRASTGTVTVDGKRMRRGSVTSSVAAGVGLAPEERKSQGLLLDEAVYRNITVSSMARFARFGFLRSSEERRRASEITTSLDVRPDGVTRAVRTLSGGNQQKVVLARWLAANSRILILDEPTRGVDVGAKAEIHRLIRDLAARGNAVLLISSELPEVIAISHRVLVMRQGRIVTEVPHEQATQELLLRLMAGVELAPAA